MKVEGRWSKVRGRHGRRGQEKRPKAAAWMVEKSPLAQTVPTGWAQEGFGCAPVAL